jgi:hypothetical protein
MAHTGNTYSIKTVHDFAKVPEDRLDECLHEFKMWLALMAFANSLVEECGEDASLQIQHPQSFDWIDDGKRSFQMNLTDATKQVMTVEGIMKAP